MERFTFTKKNLSTLTLPPKGKRRSVYDAEVKKLMLRITHAGSKTFYVTKHTGPEVTWIKLDPFPQMTVEQARNKAQQVLGEFAGGTNPAVAKRALRGEWSFSDAFEEFLEKKRNKRGAELSDRTKSDYRDVVRLHLDSIKNYKLSKLTKEQVKTLHRTISKKSHAQADRALAVISSVYNYVIDCEIFAGRNPASRVQKNPAVERARFVKPRELPYLFNAINQSALCDFFWLALLTGARRSNIQSMTWRDVDLPSCIWKIPVTKNGEWLEVPLVEEAVQLLKDRKKAAAPGAVFVFPGTGKTGHLVEPKKSWTMVLRRASFDLLLEEMLEAEVMDQNEVNAARSLAEKAMHLAEAKYHKLADKAKIRPEDHSVMDIHIHDLRRTFGTYQNRTGASLSIIGQSLGHKSERSTRIYARLDLDPVRGSIESGTTSMLRAAGQKAPAAVIPFPEKGAA